MTRAYPILLIAVAAAFLAPHFADPFVRPHEANNAIYGLAARNHQRLGILQTKFSNCLSVGGAAPEGSELYFNHPGTLSLLVAIPLALSGGADWSVRVIPALFSIACVLALFAAVRHRWGDKAGFLAGLFLACSPMAAYYGKIANFEPLLAPMGILLADRFGRSTEDKQEASHAPAAMLAGAMTLIDYGAVFLPIALLVSYGPRRGLLQIILAAGAAVAALVAQILWIGGLPGLEAFLAQGLLRGGVTQSPSLWEFARLQSLRFWHLTATPVGCLMLAGSAMALDRKRTERVRFLLALALWGLFYVLAFRQAAQVHEYWQFLLAPAVAATLGLATARLKPGWILVVLALFAFQSSSTLSRHLYADIGWYDREFAAVAFARTHSADAVILTREEMRTYHPQYYTDRRFVFDPSLLDSFAAR